MIGLDTTVFPVKGGGKINNLNVCLFCVHNKHVLCVSVCVHIYIYMWTNLDICISTLNFQFFTFPILSYCIAQKYCLIVI